MAFGPLAYSVAKYLQEGGAQTRWYMMTVALGGATMVLAIALGCRNGRRHQAEALRRPVEMVEGVPELFELEEAGLGELTVGKLDTNVTLPQLWALDPGRSYRFYYVEHGFGFCEILAVEPSEQA
jgi:hypothetical protein